MGLHRPLPFTRSSGIRRMAPSALVDGSMVDPLWLAHVANGKKSDPMLETSFMPPATHTPAPPRRNRLLRSKFMFRSQSICRSTTPGLADAAAAPDAVAATAAGADTDAFPMFVNFIESAIKACDGVLTQATGQKSFGISIVLFTLVLKGLTYPLTKAQLTSTTKMQAIQPKVGRSVG